MTIALIVGVAIVVLVLVGAVFYGAAWAIDQWIKEYIDYAKKGKDDGGSRRA